MHVIHSFIFRHIYLPYSLCLALFYLITTVCKMVIANAICCLVVNINLMDVVVVQQVFCLAVHVERLLAFDTAKVCCSWPLVAWPPFAHEDPPLIKGVLGLVVKFG